MTRTRLITRVLGLAAVVCLVSISPSVSTVGAQQLGGRISGTLTAATQFVALDVSGSGAAAVQLTGTWAGTISFEGSVDGGTFVALNMVPSNSATAASSSTANGAWNANIGGYSLVRARASAWTSGTATVTIAGATSGGR